jgi:hypothetical protein
MRYCVTVKGVIELTHQEERRSGDGEMSQMKSIVGTVKADWKAQVLFWSMVICGMLIISSVVVVMARLI